MCASKYLNRKVQTGGRTFDSAAEARRFAELRILERAGAVEGVECQPSFRIEINGALICTYIADFTYLDKETGETIVEDVKSAYTRKLPVYRLKRRLMKAVHGIDITEVVK